MSRSSQLLTRRRLVRAAALAAGAALAPAALATHLVEHRFTVWGRITRPDGSPAADVEVRLTVKGGKALGSVRSNAEGLYRAILHVHDTDVGKVFDIHVGGQSRKVRLLFNPQDHRTERGQRIDWVLEPGGADGAPGAAGG